MLAMFEHSIHPDDVLLIMWISFCKSAQYTGFFLTSFVPAIQHEYDPSDVHTVNLHRFLTSNDLDSNLFTARLRIFCSDDRGEHAFTQIAMNVISTIIK